MLSWGPPHAPYNTAPEEFQDLYEHMDIQLRPNVPEELIEETKYVRHIRLKKPLFVMVDGKSSTGVILKS